MKLIKGFLAIAIISLVAISCKETKKEVSDESVDVIEVTDEVVTESMDANASDAESVIDSTSTELEKEADSTKTMAEGMAKKCEGKCSKDGKSCDGSCKA